MTSDLGAAALLVTSACDQLYTFLPDTGDTVEADLRAVVRLLHAPAPAPAAPAAAPLSYSLHSIISYEAVLCPTSDLSRLAAHLATLVSLHQAPVHALLCEVTRCCSSPTPTSSPSIPSSSSSSSSSPGAASWPCTSMTGSRC